MLEESMSIPEIWASINSWFTPTVLFVLLNIMIGTILFTSGLTSQTPQQSPQQKQQDQDEKSMEDSYQQRNRHQQQQHTDLNRAPSVLQRLKSINFYAYSFRSQDPISVPAPDLHTHEVNRHDLHTHVPEQEKAHTFDETEHPHEETELPLLETEQPKTMEEVYRQLQGSHNRTKSDTVPTSGDIPVRLPRKMKKSASTKSAFAHFEEEDIVEARRPATVRESSSKLTSEEDDEDDDEVDAKADDFINRFKNQLKMQRLESIVRYKDLVNREKK